MIRLRGSVRLHGIRPELVVAMVVADGVYHEFGSDLTVTSVTDGKHMRASIHYVGGAFDAALPGENVARCVIRLKFSLGPDFDVVQEKDHIHIEWQPKVAYS